MAEFRNIGALSGDAEELRDLLGSASEETH